MKNYLENKLFRWNLDEDGDLVLSFCRVVHVTYYKWHDTPIVKFGRRNLKPAPKGVWRAIQTFNQEN